MEDKELNELIATVSITAFNIGDLAQVDIGFQNKTAAKNLQAIRKLKSYIQTHYTRNEDG